MFKLSIYILLAFLLVGTVYSQQQCLDNVVSYTDQDRANIPASFDARTQWPNCISPVRDQGSCSSCWAMTSSSILADRLCIASGGAIKKLLSPQYMVDCAKNCKTNSQSDCNSGCKFGFLDISMEYLSNGISAESCLPYKESDATCPSQCKDGSPIQLYYGSGCISIGNLKDAQLEIMKNGPILAVFQIFTSLYNIGSGLYRGTGDPAEGHAARVIGWGEENGTPYWLALNSWGTEFGMDGAFKVPMGENIAGFESQLLSVKPNVDASPKGADANWNGGSTPSTGDNNSGNSGSGNTASQILQPISIVFILITLLSSAIVMFN
ncbi:hypothetical protein PPL_08471 [Heterostelium album PN500]|uniref:Peptidase C1A papain C-terminal domain-containing protein n=1 Tax=Heterostelium pallidum (strain ATCC 26659 / Pp 5 / PN500) TaxID=670386 RepID=D3BIA3_HETP5|nr:hypothetical protein PPL_08471 [Heterostelium album PN500]EFA79003.1 hypothetical protein PPL_08471 [Heterostelium album PN500]|eukprot:XP_020431127.1 hypothetical protein PPL_08471 [Heterostelium album PN500]